MQKPRTAAQVSRTHAKISTLSNPKKLPELPDKTTKPHTSQVVSEDDEIEYCKLYAVSTNA